MQIGRIAGATRVLGQSQGYIGLPVRDEIEFDKASGLQAPSMTTAWFPDPAEVEAIVAGAPVHFTLLGNRHPPCRAWVGDRPEE